MMQNGIMEKEGAAGRLGSTFKIRSREAGITRGGRE
jgi:hypothetical protein